MKENNLVAGNVFLGGGTGTISFPFNAQGKLKRIFSLVCNIIFTATPTTHW